MEMAEWRDYGTHCYYINGEIFLNIFHWKVRLNAFRQNITKHLGLKSKETLRKNYLNPAMEFGLVRMTIPDKPKSKNQRYIKQ